MRNRLDQELVGNVSLRVLDGDRPDAWEVQGRGELQLAVLVEQMRREGFELTIGKPQVVTRRIDGVLSEPVERLAIDVPEAYSGVVIGLLALRKGKMEQMVNHGTGWVRLDYLVPARGLIGFRTEFITETRGTGILHHVFEGFAPWFGELKTRPNGSLVADRRGVSTSHALMSLQERGELFIGPAVDVYEGMVIGVNARPEDLDVNVAKEKKASNMRSAHAEELVRLAPPRQLSLEQALEFIREDEAVEVTPSHVRLRKVVLPAGGRTKTARAAPPPRSAPSSLTRVSSMNALPDGSRASGPAASSSIDLTGRAEALDQRGRARPRRQHDLEAAQSRRARRGRPGAAAAPGVGADVVVVAAGREERRLRRRTRPSGRSRARRGRTRPLGGICETCRWTWPIVVPSGWRVERLRLRVAELAEQAVEVERIGAHALGDLALPQLPRPVGVDLDAVPVGVAEVDRLAHEMVGRAGQAHALAHRVGDPAREAAAVRQQQGEVEEAGAARARAARPAPRRARAGASVPAPSVALPSPSSSTSRPMDSR